MPSRSGLRKSLIALMRWLCAGILIYAAGRQIFAELKKLQGTELKLDLPLLFGGAALYAAAMACFAAYWRQAALDMGGRPGRLEAQRAYFASQLGKYIPGKAWVIFIRCALINSQTTTAPVIIASTFYETLAMMAAGSLLALIALLSAGHAPPVMLGLSGGLAAGLLFATLPPVFARLATWTARSFQKAGTIPIAAITYTTWFQGFRYFIPGWTAAGLSLLAIAGSLGISLFGFAGISAGLRQHCAGHCGRICSVDCSGRLGRQRVGIDADPGAEHWDQQRGARCDFGPDHACFRGAVRRRLSLSARKTKE